MVPHGAVTEASSMPSASQTVRSFVVPSAYASAQPSSGSPMTTRGSANGSPPSPITRARCGIPVYAERGRDGGFALLSGFSTDLTGLTPDEAVALLTARSRATSDALGLGPAFASAMR